MLIPKRSLHFRADWYVIVRRVCIVLLLLLYVSYIHLLYVYDTAAAAAVPEVVRVATYSACCCTLAPDRFSRVLALCRGPPPLLLR